MDPKNIDPVVTRRALSPVPLVRLYEARVALNVALLVDLSASMGFAGHARKLREAARLAACLSYSAYRLGDRSMLLGFGDELELHFPAKRSPDYPLELGAAIWEHEPTSSGVGAMERACDLLPRQRSLVFLVSDFHFDRATLERGLAALAGHDLVLTVLWDPAEGEHPPSPGWTELHDPETGARTRRWLRRGFAERARRRLLERREMLEETAAAFGAATLFLGLPFDAAQLIDFFVEWRA
jgi:uncharacterized protein (DUF58 family)